MKSEATRAKISQSLKTSKRAQEQRARLSLMRRGKPCLEETKVKISQSLKGRPLAEETKRKIAVGLRGHIRSAEHRANISKVHKTSQRCQEQLAQLWERNKDKPRPEECKAKLRAARLRQRIPSYNTKPELQFQSICEELKFQFKYVGDGKFWIENINPDFVDANARKIAVDIFGDYWHSPLFRKKAARWEYTEEGRRATLRKYGWRLVVFWESELKLPDAKERVLRKVGTLYGRHKRS